MPEMGEPVSEVHIERENNMGKWILLALAIKDLEGVPTPSTLILGQVVGVHIDPAFLKDGLFDITAAGTIARCGYRGDYAEVTSLFEMLRPVL